MLVKSLSDLPPAQCRAIIVNVSTKEVATLALFSILRYTSFPILLLDLESTDGSWEHFSQLAESEPRLDLCQGVLQKHGYVLDKIFRESRDEDLLLVDSDLEICDSDIVGRMLNAVSGPGVFGAGAVHGPSWLDHRHGFSDHLVLFRERMWIPFTMLRVASIQKALADGYSFINRWEPNEMVRVPWLAKLLSRRFFLPGIKHIRANFLSATRRTFGAFRPNLVCNDTGAEIFCYLRDVQKEQFTDFGLPLIESLVHHYHGVTRRKLHSGDRNAADVDDIMMGILQRLRDEYGYSFSADSAALKS